MFRIDTKKSFWKECLLFLAAAMVLGGCAGLEDGSVEAESAAERSDEGSTGRVLVVVSAATELQLQPGADGTPRSVPTGYFLNELAEALRVLGEAGYDIDIATPGGVTPTIDINGFEDYFYKLQVGPFLARAQRDEDIATAMEYFGKLTFSASKTSAQVQEFVAQIDEEQAGLPERAMLRLEDLASDEALAVYDGVYVPGGHAPKVDLLYSPAMGKVLEHFHRMGKPTALICHAPIVLLSAFPQPWSPSLRITETDKRNFIYSGYRATIGNVPEEQLLENFLYLKGERLQFYVEPELREAGLRVNTFRVPATAQYVQDRELLTGANPASTAALAQALLIELNAYRLHGSRR